MSKLHAKTKPAVKAEAIRKPRDVGLKQADLLKTGQAFYIQQRYSKSHKKMDALMDDFYTERVAPAKQNMIRLGGKK